MKREEKLVNQYLISKGYENIVPEPDGNIPPDFSINNNIAIEVRRLNQHFELNGKRIPLEDLDYKIYSTLKKILKEFEISDYEHSAFLSVHFKRPLSVTKVLKTKIIEILNEHLTHLDQQKKYKIHDNLLIEFIPCKKKLESVYRLGFFSDDNGGGFIVSLIYSNLKYIIEEKERKISPYKERYNEWWLALVDTIGYGLDNLDLSQLNDLPMLKTFFDKILVIPPLNPNNGVVIFDK